MKDGRTKGTWKLRPSLPYYCPLPPNLQFHFSNQNKFPMLSWLRILISKGRSVSCNCERNKGPRHWPLQKSQTKTPSTLNQPVMILFFCDKIIIHLSFWRVQSISQKERYVRKRRDSCKFLITFISFFVVFFSNKRQWKVVLSFSFQSLANYLTINIVDLLLKSKWDLFRHYTHFFISRTKLFLHK